MSRLEAKPWWPHVMSPVELRSYIPLTIGLNIDSIKVRSNSLSFSYFDPGLEYETSSLIALL
jgi:hypothetical protein